MNEWFILKKHKEISGWLDSNSKVLEIGCGKAPILKFKPSLDYTGLDHNKEVIKKLRKSKIKAYEIDLDRDTSLRLKKGYDYILFIDILEHLHNPGKVVRYFKKYLGKKGKIIVSLPNDYNIANKLRFITNKKIVKYPFWEHGHLHIYPIKEGQKFLEKQGFKIIDKKYLTAQKPKFIPQAIKDVLAQIMPNSFSRVVLYLAKPI